MTHWSLRPEALDSLQELALGVPSCVTPGQYTLRVVGGEIPLPDTARATCAGCTLVHLEQPQSLDREQSCAADLNSALMPHHAVVTLHTRVLMQNVPVSGKTCRPLIY